MDNSNLTSLRTTDELSELFLLAKIDESNLKSLTQILFTERKKDFSNIKLIELDEHLLETIEAGDSLSFRGEKEESITLCTNHQTYDVKEAETSNSLLLLPKLKFHTEISDSDSRNQFIEEQEVQAIFYSYLEVRECKPKFSKLSLILGETAFNGIEYEKLIDPKKLYDWDKLRSKIQSSDEELKQALSDYLIVNIDGYYRMISFEYEARALTNMLEFEDDSSFEPDEVDKEETLEALQELIPESIFNVLFEKYAKPSGKFKQGFNDSTKIPLYRYSEEKVCKMLAKVLLTASPVTEYTGFMEAWNIGTPEGMKSKEEYLNGVAVIKWNAERNRKEVVSFPEHSLPDSIEKRFDELFKVKDKWTVEEITPYISNLASNKLNVNALLTKYARLTVKNEVKYYSSKHGK